VLDRIGQPAALAHCDLGSGIEAETAALAHFLGPVLVRAMAPGGIVLSDQELDLPGSVRLSPPPGIDPERYFISRVQSRRRA
jgi:hypothetical protein